MLGRCVIYYVLGGNEVGSSECWTAVGAELHSFGSPKLCLLFHNNNNGDLFSVLLRCLNESIQISGPTFYFCHLRWSCSKGWHYLSFPLYLFFCIFISFALLVFLYLFLLFLILLLPYISFLFFISFSLSLLSCFLHCLYVYYDKISLCCNSYNCALFKAIKVLCDS